MRRAHTVTVGLLLASLWLAAEAGPAFGGTAGSVDQSLMASQEALRQKHYAEAVRILQSALKRYPGDRRLQVELGQAYIYDRQDERAIRIFREVLRRDPANRTAKLELAQVLGYHRNYDASNQLYRELLKADTDDEDASVGLIRNLIHQGRTTEARRELGRALAHHPKSVRLQEAQFRSGPTQ